MRILEYWLGKKSKAEVAKEIGVKPLRVWQLSQQALSGMMAGLLKQPRKRVGPEAFVRTVHGESPTQLRRRIVRLEAELSRTEDMVRVLRTAPWRSESAESPVKGGKARGQAKKNARPARRKGEDRTQAPGARAQPRGAGGVL
jgi:hypothetical protein